MFRPLAALLAAALALPARASGPPRPLRLDLEATAWVAGGEAAVFLASQLLEGRLAPAECRWCAPDRLDRAARDALRWGDERRAALGSNVLLAAVPVLTGGALAVSALEAGGRRAALEDLVVTAEAVLAADLLTQVAKYSAGRLRPESWADPAAPRRPDAFLSFWSGHTSTTFAAAAAAGTVARLRGYRSWPWILGLGLAGAAATGWLRVAADRHWLSDVLAGAAAGTLCGLGIPVWLHAPREAKGAGGLAVAPLSVAFSF